MSRDFLFISLSVHTTDSMVIYLQGNRILFIIFARKIHSKYRLTIFNRILISNLNNFKNK